MEIQAIVLEVGHIVFIACIMTELKSNMEGYLHKWAGYTKGYRWKYFILSEGRLSYCKRRSRLFQVSLKLEGARINFDPNNFDNTFVVANEMIKLFLKAKNQTDRQQWVDSIGLIIKQLNSDKLEESATEKMISNLVYKFAAVEETKRIIQKYYKEQQEDILEIQKTLSTASEAAIMAKVQSLYEKVKVQHVSTKVALKAAINFYDVTKKNKGLMSHDVINSEKELLSQEQQDIEELEQRQLDTERESNAYTAESPNAFEETSSESSDDFYDANEDAKFEVKTPCSKESLSRSALQAQDRCKKLVEMEANSSSSNKESEDELKVTDLLTEPTEQAQVVSIKSRRMFQSDVCPAATSLAKKPQRRSRIPDKPDLSLNLWKIIKQNWGKSLFSIKLPVNINEPLSMLQRLTEEYQYSDILDTAAGKSDSCEQLSYVAAFVVSCYGTTSFRTTKPFNPLLGETYEWDRTDDLGWRCVSEQVCHRPRTSAQFCESKNWVCYQEFSVDDTSSYTSIKFEPKGDTHLKFPATGNHYVWGRVKATAHNIFFGKLWIDHYGKLEIMNHKTGEKCFLKFEQYKYCIQSEGKQVTGRVFNIKGEAAWTLNGTWDKKLEAENVAGEPFNQKKHVLWSAKFPPKEAEKYYNFSEFACQMNEIEDGVAPTDSRNRPDQRLMEETHWDEATMKKFWLEDRQRKIRKQREVEKEHAEKEGKSWPEYEPVWFKKKLDPVTNSLMYFYKGGYWECKENKDWTICPNIFRVGS
ncbi:oxysterol-binding protein 1-like [Artemia franciscana]